MQFNKRDLRDNSINCITSFAGVLIAVTLTPQFGLNPDSPIKNYQLFQSTGVALAILVCNKIIGIDSRMYTRNRAEFFANKLVSVFLGWVIVDLLLAVFQNQLLGRIVIFNGILADTLLTGLFVKIMFSGKPAREKLYAIGHGCFSEKVRHELNRDGFDVECIEYKNNGDSILSNIIDNPYAVVVDSRLAIDIPSFGGERRQLRIVSNEIFEEEYFQRKSLTAITNLAWWRVRTKLTSVQSQFIKRTIDIPIALIGLTATMPFIAVIFLLYRLTSSGPVFYSQTRLGSRGVQFKIFKIRSMHIGAETQGAQWASTNDTRVTRVGKWLRRTRLDEVPQFWNILKGDMSFVGPRPERPELSDKIVKKHPEFLLRLAVKPGITGWAQVSFPYGASIEDSLTKLAYDLYYIENANLIFDIKIILRTLIAMVKGAR